RRGLLAAQSADPGLRGTSMSLVEVEDLGRAQRASPQALRRRLLVRRFLRRPLAVAGLIVALAFVLAAIFAPWVAPYSPSETDFEAILAKPSLEHLLGTDELGRDILSRIIWGARASIMAGVFATLLAMVVGVPIGLV